MLSYTEENYLKIVYGLLALNPAGASTNEIAARMNTKASSVTDMMQKLADKKLLKYKKYQGVKLTEEGRLVAVQIIRKHRLWEVFLKEKLGFGWDEVHELAEQLEHIKSEELTNRLDRFLGFPKFDPHGDPIPDKDGHIETKKSKLISELLVNQSGLITGVQDSTSTFLQYLDKHALVLGTPIKVLEIFEFDHSVKIKAGNSEMTISYEVSKNIKVQTQ
jgi:DtxR family transcriptional regulator, Mn-dependent transcriptional regulator